MTGRSSGFRHNEETRAKIQAAQIINRFMACLNGEVVLDAQQVSCGKSLLNKVLPDLQSVDGNLKHEHEVGDTLGSLLEKIASNGRRIFDKP